MVITHYRRKPPPMGTNLKGCSRPDTFLPRIVTPFQGFDAVYIRLPGPSLSLQPGLLYYALSGLGCYLKALKGRNISAQAVGLGLIV
jgi:hypothetical protein